VLGKLNVEVGRRMIIPEEDDPNSIHDSDGGHASAPQLKPDKRRQLQIQNQSRRVL
jgi:hypothetical protein